jgi:drug/metabolite transporter (DMT)-like permease
MKTSIIYILISVVGGAAGQVLLKMGMNSLGPLTLSAGQFLRIIWSMATNLYVIIGLAIYMLGVVFWLAAISRVDLSFAYPFASLSYVLMLLVSWGIFGEKISLLRLVGTIVICVGVLIIARS